MRSQFAFSAVVAIGVRNSLNHGTQRTSGVSILRLAGDAAAVVVGILERDSVLGDPSKGKSRLSLRGNHLAAAQEAFARFAAVRDALHGFFKQLVLMLRQQFLDDFRFFVSSIARAAHGQRKIKIAYSFDRFLNGLCRQIRVDRRNLIEVFLSKST